MDMRIGHGYDLHRLREGGKLLLAGVVASQEMSAIAHSDGDVILHAIVDAMLGAIGGGDIGEHFPDTDPRWKGAASSVFLDITLQQVREAGFELVNIDVTLLAERPRIKALRSIMVDSLRKLLHDPQLPINIKAGTNEGCDAIGRGEAIAAHAVVLLRAVQK
jgi:2-C-methyl-D-erythritol 2,4-cyclodiphosphate synthase